jgi:hypothetical protein
VTSKALAPYLAALVFAAAAGIAAQRFWSESGVEPEYFAVIAQVIPVLVLAYLLETRGRAASLLETKEMIQATFRHLETSRQMAGDRNRSLGQPTPDHLSDPTNPELLGHADEIASLDRTVDLVKTSNVVTAITAGLGEMVALYALADGSTDVALFSLTFGIVIFLGVSLVIANSVAMESLTLKVGAKVHRRRAEEARDAYLSLKANQDLLKAKHEALAAEAEFLAKAIRAIAPKPDEIP